MAQISFTIPDLFLPKIEEAFQAVAGKPAREALRDYVREVYRAYRVTRARDQVANQTAAEADRESAGVV